MNLITYQVLYTKNIFFEDLFACDRGLTSLRQFTDIAVK